MLYVYDSVTKCSGKMLEFFILQLCSGTIVFKDRIMSKIYELKDYTDAL